jgi:hypothetical protein
MLPYAEWENTLDTLHMWTQIVGKTRMEFTPLVNHWWNVTLYVTPRGLNTSPIPYSQKTFDVDIDLVAHKLAVRTSEGQERSFALYPRSVADFYAEYKSALHSLGIEIQFKPVPSEFDDTTPYDLDQHHASYDREYVERFRYILLHSDRLLKKYRSGFIGKASPVHFFWGSFDLTVACFCGRRAPERPGADHMMREGYSHEEISCGFWPGDRRFKHPAYYSYTAPAPPGFAEEKIQPAPAKYDNQLGEFILEYEDVRASETPEQAVLEFCQSGYEAGAKLAKWDRESLERHPRS